MSLRRIGITFTLVTLVVLTASVSAQNPVVDLSADSSADSSAEAPRAQVEAQRAKVEPRAIIFGGDREFPPYEFLDDNGQPQGFNIHLIRALAREAGLAVEIRLGPRDERMAEFDAGQTDVMFLSYSDERAARYQLLDQTWTLSQVIMMRPGWPATRAAWTTCGACGWLLMTVPSIICCSRACPKRAGPRCR